MIRWHKGPREEAIYERINDALKPILQEVAPYHELTHIGLHTNELTEKVDIVLHLAPIGTVRVVPGTEEAQKDPITLYYEDRNNGVHAAKAP